MNLKKIWKKSRIIRPLYWAVYTCPPVAFVRHRAYNRKQDRLLHDTLPPLYGAAAAAKGVRRDKVLFVEYRGKTLTDNFRLIYDRLAARGDLTLKVHYLQYDQTGRGAYAQRAKALVLDMADAGTVFLNEANEVVSCVKMRPETQVVQLWHACGAFKKFGMSTADKIFGSDRDTLRAHPNYRNLSLVTVSSPEVVWAYREAMDLEGQPTRILPLGISRTDVFFDEDRIRGAREHLRKCFPASEGRQVILYAPTFRGHVHGAAAPDQLDLSAMAEALGDRFVLVCKHHPFGRAKDRPVIPGRLSSFARDLTDEMSIEELLMASDVCISDYSSVIFEFSLFERPMLFFAYDLEKYDDWRGFYYSYDEMTPGPVCRTTQELIGHLKNPREDSLRAVRAFREKFMSACDGHATDRILETVFGAGSPAGQAGKEGGA